MGAGPFGGASMGGVALSAGGMVPQPFLNMPPGGIRALDVDLTFKAKSSAGGTFTLSVSNAATEGTDDMDLIGAAIMPSMSLWWDESLNAGNLTFAQWRTVLGALNQHDFAGTVTNGATVPGSGSSAASWRICMRFPVSLSQLFHDGGIFANGSARLSKGRMEYTAGSSLTPNVASLANASGATFNVTNLAVSIYCNLGPGTANDTGPLWRVFRPANLATSVVLTDATRLFLADVTPPASATVTSYNVGPHKLVTPGQLQDKYTLERLYSSGYDITQRCTPLYWTDEKRGLADFLADLQAGPPLIEQAAGSASSLTILDVQLVPVDASTQAAVTQYATAGGPATISHPSPRSLPPGSPIPAALAGIAPSRITPGTAAPSSQGSATVVHDPAAAGQHQLQRSVQTQNAGRVLRRFNKA